MYLRLKTSRSAATQPACASVHVTADLHHELLRRHYVAFDWRHGGPPGPIKYIDVHQLEFASAGALAGDNRSHRMVRRYLDGVVRLCAGNDDGAAHYATGPAWNAPCVQRTLAGQAAALFALALGGHIIRRRLYRRLAHGIAAFTCRRWGDDVGLADRYRDRAWFASALLHFASVYDDAPVRRLAGTCFDSLDIAVRDPASRAVLPFALDDHVAYACAARDFGIAGHRRSLLRAAYGHVAIAARRFVHPQGGWCDVHRDGSPPDNDCTIELVRLAESLRDERVADRDTMLDYVIGTGTRTLLNPPTALSRSPESGILLLGNGPRRIQDSPVPVPDAPVALPRAQIV